MNLAMNYQDKVAVVTGGASGIGAAIVANLLTQGASVVVADLQPPEPQAMSARVTYFRHDISQESSWKALFASVREQHGRLDLLVNNAGIMHPADIETTSLEMFSKTLSVNAQGCFLGCQSAIAEMRAYGKPGAIVNISSTTALRSEPWVMAYAASKAAVVSMTRTIALHLARAGVPIRCNAVLPGVCLTPMVRTLVEQSPDPAAAMKGLESLHPIGRVLQPAEVANVVVFVGSDLASGMMGAAVVVDGGLTIA